MNDLFPVRPSACEWLYRSLSDGFRSRRRYKPLVVLVPRRGLRLGFYPALPGTLRRKDHEQALSI